MNKWFKIIVVAGLVLTAFAAGRLTMPKAERISPGNSELDSAWDNYIQAQEHIRDYLISRPFYENDEQSSAEAHRLILYSLPAAIELALHNPEFPRFTRIADDDAKSGMENPDNEYRMAIVDGAMSYRISGQIPSGRRLYLQSVIGQPGVGDSGPGTFAGSLAPSDIKIDSDGRFEVFAGLDPPPGGGTWLQMDRDVETILVRLTDPDWQGTNGGDWLHIERLCESDCPSFPDTLSSPSAARLLNATAQSMHDRTVSWVSIAERVWANIPENGFGPPRPTPNGLAGQYSAWGTFNLASDEALIFSVPASSADYQGLQLASRWFISLDYRNRQSSLTREQARIGPEDHIKFVIAHNDPGVHNWLDPEGHVQGLIMLRWQGISSPPRGPFNVQTVPIETVVDYFDPGDRISPKQRQDALKNRAHKVDQRFQ